MAETKSGTQTTALDVALASLPLYGAEPSAQQLMIAAADRLSTVLGTPLAIELRASGESWSSGVRPDGDVREIEFGEEDAGGRAIGAGQSPEEAVRRALEIELERLCIHIAALRAIGTRLDRLEFRLQGLHQIARTLRVVRKVPDTEANIVDFTGELLFAWWIALYRPRDHVTLEPRSVRSLSGEMKLPELPQAKLA